MSIKVCCNSLCVYPARKHDDGPPGYDSYNCPACYVKHGLCGVWTPVLPPSALTPAPRWGVSPPRVGKVSDETGEWSRADDRWLPWPRVRRVRAERTDLETGHGSTHLAKWKFA